MTLLYVSMLAQRHAEPSPFTIYRLSDYQSIIKYLANTLIKSANIDPNTKAVSLTADVLKPNTVQPMSTRNSNLPMGHC